MPQVIHVGGETRALGGLFEGLDQGLRNLFERKRQMERDRLEKERLAAEEKRAQAAMDIKLEEHNLLQRKEAERLRKEEVADIQRRLAAIDEDPLTPGIQAPQEQIEAITGTVENQFTGKPRYGSDITAGPPLAFSLKGMADRQPPLGTGPEAPDRVMGRTGSEALAGLKSSDLADITKRARDRADYLWQQQNKAFQPPRWKPTKPDVYYDTKKGKNSLVSVEAYIADPSRYEPKRPEGDDEKSDWVWNNKTNRPEYVSRSAQASAPKGMYSDKVSGRQSAERGARNLVMTELINQTDEYIKRYQETLQGPRGFLPSWLDPEKYRNIDAVRSASGSLAQFFGRTVLGDYRVSDQDRPVYQNAIASLNEMVNIIDPDEILLRWENGKKLFDLYMQNYGGQGGGTSDASTTEDSGSGTTDQDALADEMRKKYGGS